MGKAHAVDSICCKGASPGVIFLSLNCLWVLHLSVSCKCWIRWGAFVLQRNYRFFLCFVMSTTVLDLYVHAWSWARLGYISTHEHVSFGHAIREEPAAMALIGYTFLAFM